MTAKHHGKRPRATAQDVIRALTTARAAAVTPRGDTRGQSRANMLKQLAADGITPVADPGAGLRPAQASMARIVA